MGQKGKHLKRSEADRLMRFVFSTEGAFVEKTPELYIYNVGMIWLEVFRRYGEGAEHLDPTATLCADGKILCYVRRSGAMFEFVSSERMKEEKGWGVA